MVISGVKVLPVFKHGAGDAEQAVANRTDCAAIAVSASAHDGVSEVASLHRGYDDLKILPH